MSAALAAAIAQQAQALVATVAAQLPTGSPVDVLFQPKQSEPTPARVIGHRVEIEATDDSATVRAFAHIEFQSRRLGGTQTRFIGIERVQLQQPDGSDATTA